MADFDNSLPAVGSNYPVHAVDASEFTRVEPLLTVEQLKSRQLFGIPLVSPIIDPITRKPAVMDDTILKDRILGAANRIEFETGVSLLPVQHEVRLAFDRHEYSSFGYMQLPHRPVGSIEQLAIVAPSGDVVFQIPPEWIAPGHLQMGQINIVPLQPAFVGGNQIVPSQSGSGMAFISFLGQMPYIPEYWGVKYTCGFKEGKIPRVINDLIGCQAAIDILATLQSLNRNTSQSIGIDALSQSTSGPGPQVYQARIDQLLADRKELISRVKATYGLKFLAGTL